MWMKRSAWSLIAATTFGCECPVVTTAMPAVKSRNRLPSTSVTQHPRPWSMTNGYERVKLGDIDLASRAMSSAAFGPGSGVLISGLVTGRKHNGRDASNQGETRQVGARGDPGRSAADHGHLQLGGQPDLRHHRLRAAGRRGGSGVVGDARPALEAPGRDRRDRG